MSRDAGAAEQERCRCELEESLRRVTEEADRAMTGGEREA